MALTEQQKKHLRGLGHSLKPVVQIGQGGVTPNVLNEVEQALEHHELIKLKARVGDRTTRDAMIKQLVATTRADLVQQIGNVAVIYRRSPEQARIVIPAR